MANIDVQQPTKANGKQPPKERVDRWVQQFVAVREALRILDNAHKEKRQQYTETLSQLEGLIVQFLEATGQEAARTEFGTCYLSTRYTASLADPDAFMDYVITNKKFTLLDRRANSTAVREHTEEFGALPPGATLNAMRTVGVRKS